MSNGCVSSLCWQLIIAYDLKYKSCSILSNARSWSTSFVVSYESWSDSFQRLGHGWSRKIWRFARRVLYSRTVRDNHVWCDRSRDIQECTKLASWFGSRYKHNYKLEAKWTIENVTLKFAKTFQSFWLEIRSMSRIAKWRQNLLLFIEKRTCR